MLRIIYNAAMSACEKAAEWEVALLLLETAEQRQLQTDVISHNAAISPPEAPAPKRYEKHLEHTLLEVVRLSNVSVREC